MFGNASKLAEANRVIKLLEAENVELQEQLARSVKRNTDLGVKLADRPTLVDIRRDGRSLHFTFVRNGAAFMIETMGLMSDNVKLWKKQAGLND